MADGIHCETRSFFELLNTSQEIRVPIYQRRYSWAKDEIERLWEDLLETLTDPPAEQGLFLGSIVFHGVKNSDGSLVRYLVDGQQRLTTLAMMLAVMRHRLLETKSMELGATVGKFNSMLFRLDAKTTGQLRPDAPLRLTAAKKDAKQFNKLVTAGEHTDKRARLFKGWKVIETLVKDAIDERITRLLVARGHDRKNVEHVKAATLDAVRELAFSVDHVISTVAVFSVIRVEAPFDPLTVFESLNSKNLPLAQSDLVKNLLMQRTKSEEDQEEIARSWDHLADPLGEDLVRFLRAWYIAKYEHLTLKQLHNKLQDRITNQADAEAVLNSWTQMVPWYLAAKRGKPIDAAPKGLREALYEFSLTGFQQGIPIVLAFAAVEALPEMQRALPILETIYVRVLRSAQVRGSVFEQKVEDICRAIRKSPTEGLERLRQVAQDLILQYTDGISWKAFRPGKDELQRYILIRLARELEGPAWKAPTPETIEVEHILPQTKPAGYQDLEDEAYAELVEHIGNLTLVLKTDNAKLSNKHPSAKAATYARYAGAEKGEPRLLMTSQLAGVKDWGSDQILGRASEFAKIAERVWPVP